MFDDLKHLSVINMQKYKKSRRGQILFDSTVYGGLVNVSCRAQEQLLRKLLNILDLHYGQYNTSYEYHFKG